MSAECGTCGTDIVYPENTWPVGECPVCTLKSKLETAESALTKLRGYLEQDLAAAQDPDDPFSDEGRVREQLEIIDTTLITRPEEAEESVRLDLESPYQTMKPSQVDSNPEERRLEDIRSSLLDADLSEEWLRGAVSFLLDGLVATERERDERLRVNVGLIAENKELRRQLGLAARSEEQQECTCHRTRPSVCPIPEHGEQQ